MKGKKYQKYVKKKYNSFYERYITSFYPKVDLDTSTKQNMQDIGSQTVNNTYYVHPNIYDEFTRRERRILKKIHVL